MANTVLLEYPFVFPQDTDLPIDYDLHPHSTLIFLGESATIGTTLDELRSGLSGLQFEDTGIVDVDGLALFGENKDVLVMKLNSSNLLDNYQVASDRIEELGLKNASAFSEYSPHVTLANNYHGPTIGYTLPTTVGLGRPIIRWNDESFDIE